MFVLDELNDCETLQLLLQLLNSDQVGWRDVWGRDFEPEEVLRALKGMVIDGSVRVLRPDPGLRQLVAIDPVDWAELDEGDWWFERSDRGQQELEAWSPPN